MSARAVGLALALTAAIAHAEPGWFAARPFASDRPALRLIAGLSEAGAAAAVPLNDGSSFEVEGVFRLDGRTLELRPARVWTLRSGTLRVAGSVGLSALLVPDLALDLGLGGEAALSAAVGNPFFLVHAGVSSGAEAFVRGYARFLERLFLGASLRIGRLQVEVVGKMGVDLSPDHAFAVRAEAALLVGWSF